mmetsp:Transcript_38778/g.79288  ORF Transcript_38778/g.79288 Transcript_38778/m.79288 type:complete len:200 (+) Transcript_38778:40-639(+)
MGPRGNSQSMEELSEAVVQDLQQALAKEDDQDLKLRWFLACEKRLAEVEARNSQTLADLAAAEADGSQVKDLQEQSTAARAAMADLVTDKEESLATIKNLQGSLSQAQEQELPPMPLAPPESRMEGDELWNATANDRRDFFHRTNTPSNDEGEPAGLPLQTRLSEEQKARAVFEELRAHQPAQQLVWRLAAGRSACQPL